MARTAKVTLDSVEYEIHAFNIKELREVTGLITDGKDNLQVLAIAMRRAEPKVDFDLIEPTVTELAAATETVLKLAGIDTAKNPQTAAPAES